MSHESIISFGPTGGLIENDDIDWGKRVFTIRKGLGLGRDKAAKIIGVGPRTLLRWERGDSMTGSKTRKKSSPNKTQQKQIKLLQNVLAVKTGDVGSFSPEFFKNVQEHLKNVEEYSAVPIDWISAEHRVKELGQDPDDAPEGWFPLTDMMRKGNYEGYCDMAPVFQLKMHEAKPFFAGNFFRHWAICATKTGRPGLAIKVALDGLNIKGLANDIKRGLHNEAGIGFMRCGEFEEAEEHYRAADKLDQSHPTAKFNLMELYSLKENEKGCVEWGSCLVETNPEANIEGTELVEDIVRSKDLAWFKKQASFSKVFTKIVFVLAFVFFISTTTASADPLARFTQESVGACDSRSLLGQLTGGGNRIGAFIVLGEESRSYRRLRSRHDPMSNQAWKDSLAEFGLHNEAKDLLVAARKARGLTAKNWDSVAVFHPPLGNHHAGASSFQMSRKISVVMTTTGVEYPVIISIKFQLYQLFKPSSGSLFTSYGRAWRRLIAPSKNKKGHSFPNTVGAVRP